MRACFSVIALLIMKSGLYQFAIGRPVCDCSCFCWVLSYCTVCVFCLPFFYQLLIDEVARCEVPFVVVFASDVDGPARRLSVVERVDVAAQMAAAMVYVSSRGIVHRDVAARNFLVSDQRPASSPSAAAAAGAHGAFPPLASSPSAETHCAVPPLVASAATSQVSAGLSLSLCDGVFFFSTAVYTVQTPAPANFVDELRRISTALKSSTDQSRHAAGEFSLRRRRRILSPVLRRIHRKKIDLFKCCFISPLLRRSTV